MIKRLLLVTLIFASSLCLTNSVLAQENNRLFGAEFELAGVGERHTLWEKQRYERFQKAMEVVVRHYGGDPKDIKRIDWKVPHPTKPGDRNMYRAEWTDKQGRTWKIEPEYLGPRGLDGFELVSPPLKNGAETERLLRSLKESGQFREGLKSGAHIHIDARDMVRPNGRADALVNAILMHERFEPLIRALFNPTRGSGVFNKNRAESTHNRFARSLAVDHPELLRKLEALSPEQRTVKNVERLFQQANAAEMKAHGLKELNPSSWKVMWKYRSLNLANVININEAIPATKGTIEFRANDIALKDPKLHRLQVEFYQAMVEKAKTLAIRGETVNLESLKQVLDPSRDPVSRRGPANPYEVRQQTLEMVEFVGLDPKEYKSYVEKNIRTTRVLTEAELKERLAQAERSSATKKSVTISSSETLNSKQLAAFEARLNQSLRLESLKRGAVQAANQVKVNISQSNGQILLEATGLRNQTQRSLVEIASQQLKTGQLGSWAHSPKMESRSLSEVTRSFLTNIEGGSISKSQAELLRLVQANPAQARALAEVLGNVDKSPWLPDYTKRDLRFRKHDVLRQILEIGKGHTAESAKESTRKINEVIQNWAKETRVASHTQRSLVTSEFVKPTHTVMSRAEIRNAAVEAGLKNANDAKLKVVSSERAFVEIGPKGEVRISSAALSEIKAAADKLPLEQRPGFRRQALGLAIARQAAPKMSAIELLQQYGKQSNSKALPFERPNPQKTIEAFRGTKLFASMPTSLVADRFAKYRRADSTLRWNRMIGDGALKQGAGAAHFALALFLKELAVVIQTGDRMRIEEFFDGLATTDFFITYGLFAIGAQAGNVAYARTLQPLIKPQFVNGILRSSVVLATGMALPELYHGTFDGKAFAINLSSLGLATAAVKSGLGAIRWVTNLKKADQAGRLVRTANKFRRFAKVGGWFFTAAETAVVLYFGDEISSAVNSYLDERAAKNAIGEATTKFFEAVASDNITDDDFIAAVEEFDATHAQYRNFLYKSVLAHDAVKDRRLSQVSKEALRRESEINKQLETLRSNSRLRQAILKGQTIEQFEADRRKAVEAELKPKTEEILAAYSRAREKSLKDVYTTGRRNNAYLSNKDAAWLAEGAKVGSDNDPLSGKTDFYSNFLRGRIRSSLEDAAGDVSGNRLQAYDDQVRVLDLAIAQTSDTQKRAFLVSLRTNISDMKLRDADLVLSKTEMETQGISGALKSFGK